LNKFIDDKSNSAEWRIQMKRILKIASGFVAVVGLSCLLAAPAQARTFVSVNVGFGGYGGYGYCGYSPYYAPAYYPGYCYRAPVYYRPVCRYYYPNCYYRGGFYCR
jgi:hypothetical protein